MNEVAWKIAEHLSAVLPPVVLAAAWVVRQAKLSRKKEHGTIIEKIDGIKQELLEKIKAVDASTVLIRENDLRHVDEKLDAMQAIMLRAEGKIDQHVRDHATGAMSGA